MAKHADVPMDFADACLVRMTEQRRDCEVVTVEAISSSTAGTATRGPM
ncbi:MAG: hypothetical protein AAGI91_11120 [Bacteroidota bacterium]